MDYCVTVDMDYVWGQYQCDNVDVQIRAVTWWIWVSCYSKTLYNAHPGTSYFGALYGTILAIDRLMLNLFNRLLLYIGWSNFLYKITNY